MSPHEKSSQANLTGTAMAPDRCAEMVTATQEFPPSSPGDARSVATVRVMYAQEDPTLRPESPLPAPFVLLDKLGERLAFERAGVRLYQALVSKHEAYGTFPGGPSREDLEHVLTEEQAHFDLLTEAIEQFGGDPTELTRSANIQLSASHGVAMVLADPRVTFLESLEAILVAELADNECWQTLGDLARLAEQSELAELCEGALLTEREHLEKVRRWLALGQGRPEAEIEIEVTVSGDGDEGGDGGSTERSTGEKSMGHDGGGDGSKRKRTGSKSRSGGKSSKSRRK